MLDVDIKSEVSCEAAMLKLFVILNQIKSNFSPSLWILALFEIDGFHSCPAFHFEKNCSNQIPGFFQIRMLHRNMEFPVHSFMSELILGVPVDSAQFGVKFDESIVA